MTDLPPECDVGFKEWAGVVAALASGKQTLILRKGGIAEDGGAFRPEHRVFWLYPTRLHEAEQGLRLEVPAPPPPADPTTVPIQTLAVVDSIRRVEREEDLDALAPFHLWTPETVRQRFHYRRPGLWALGVRVLSRPEPVGIVPTPDQLGCKTWVWFDPPIPTADLTPALDDDAWEELRARF